MTERFAQMSCFVLAGGRKSEKKHFLSEDGTTRLEKSYRRYASLFEQVSLVLRKDQAKGHYLNYPHVCDAQDEESVLAGVASALENARSDAVFVGSTNLSEFPLELIVKLVKEYDGESFFGYYNPQQSEQAGQPLFGIYNRNLAGQIQKLDRDGGDHLIEFLADVGKLMPLPRGVAAESIGLG